MSNTSIIIYHTNDMHGRISTFDENTDSIGIDKISKVVNFSLLKNKNTFWFDAGDFIHGTPRMSHDEVSQYLIETLNATPINALCTGNHDYNLSMEHLYTMSKKLNAYILSANTLYENTHQHALLPYIIYDVDLKQNNYLSKTGDSNDSKYDDLKIGVFGISTPETKYKTNPINVQGIEFSDPVSTAKDMAKLLNNNCDIVIALTHLGLDESSEYTSKKLAEELKLDLIIDGHSHTVLENGLNINDTLIVQAGSHGKYLGKVTIDIDTETKSITSIQSELLNQQQVDDIIKTSDKFISSKMKTIDDSMSNIMNKVITHIDQDIPGDRELVRVKETLLGDLVADAFKWYAGTEIAIINGGSIRTGLKKGNVTLKDLVSIFPFENKVQSAKIKGSTIKEMLQHGIHSTPAAFGGFLHVSGITFTYKSNHIEEIFINNQKLNLNNVYTIAGVDFLFVGGDDYQMLKSVEIIKTFDNIENVFAKYLNAEIIKNIPLNRIKEIK